MNENIVKGFLAVNGLEVKKLTMEELRDTKKSGVRIPLELKLEVSKEAGLKQSKGEFGFDLDTVPLKSLIEQAIAEELGFELPDIQDSNKKRDLKQDIMIQVDLPKRVDKELDEESERRKLAGRKDQSKNQIMYNIIQKRFGKQS